MASSIKLLPCPFCGGEDLIIRKDYAEDDPSHCYALHVFCRDCHAHGRNNYPIGWCECEQGAIEAWNDRAVPKHNDEEQSTFDRCFESETHFRAADLRLALGSAAATRITANGDGNV